MLGKRRGNVSIRAELHRWQSRLECPESSRAVASPLAAGSCGAAVDADWQRAAELGITAVPTHLYAGKRLVGFASYDDFVRLIGKG